jgi:selenium metabolism protein YedF
MVMSIEIDARGLPCPQPVIKTKDAFEKAEGTTLLVIVSTGESRDNVIRFLKHSGAEIERTEEKAGDFYIHTKEIQSTRTADISQEEYVCNPQQSAGTTVFINKDRIGHGSDELGHNLMKAFIATIKDLSVQPRTICFMNGGVKLTANGTDTVSYLKELEEKGIELLVCGTCLNYFNIKEQSGAGRISNMYDIAEAMLKSSKVITI